MPDTLDLLTFREPCQHTELTCIFALRHSAARLRSRLSGGTEAPLLMKGLAGKSMCLQALQHLVDTYKEGEAAALYLLTKHAVRSPSVSNHSGFDET